MTTALVVSPQRYVEYLRDEDFWHADYTDSRLAKDLTFEGYSPKMDRRIYVHLALTRAWGTDEKEVIEERLLLALSLEDSAEGKVDEAEYWLARINLMGWTVRERHDVELFARTYEVQRGDDKRTKLSLTVADESLRYYDAVGMVARKLAYSVWRMWAPDFILAARPGLEPGT